MTTTDTALQREIKLTGQIQMEIIKDTQRTVTFIFDEKTNGVRVFTYSQQTDTFFLLMHIPAANSRVEALEQVLHYLKTHSDEEHTYTVLWTRLGSNCNNRSYFRARTLRELAEKFEAEPASATEGRKDPSEYVVLEVKLSGTA